MTTDAQILFALRHAGEGAISGADLAQQLGISRAAVWARIEDLRRLGYDIQANPHDGYRLLAAPDLLHGDDLMALVGPGQRIGRDIRVFQETTSTNDVVDRLGRDGVPEGVVVFAESQTKGRGRLGRGWLSPKGKGLWFSILLRPAFPPQSATKITVMAATALLRGLRGATGLRCEIKWPNDLLLNGKKICGVLTELSAELDKVKYIVLGIGVDVNLAPGDLPPDLQSIATSLRIGSGREHSRSELAAHILRELNRDYERVLNGDFEELADEWEANCTTIGNYVEITGGERPLRGRAESLDSGGALLLRTEHGRLERVMGGDVTIRK